VFWNLRTVISLIFHFLPAVIRWYGGYLYFSLSLKLDIYLSTFLWVCLFNDAMNNNLYTVGDRWKNMVPWMNDADSGIPRNWE
jgi:hypothetical protein